LRLTNTTLGDRRRSEEDLYVLVQVLRWTQGSRSELYKEALVPCLLRQSNCVVSISTIMRIEGLLIRNKSSELLQMQPGWTLAAISIDSK